MFSAILSDHHARYPAMQIEDLYKLLHQGVMGSEHAVSDPAAARAWLERELGEMGAGPPEPLTEPISPDGRLLRVHLRPYVAQGGDAEALLAAFIRTANESHGDPRLLVRRWRLASGLRFFPRAEMERFFQSMQAQGFPAVHHSDTYSRLYRPAYRVVAAPFPDPWSPVPPIPHPRSPS